MDPQSHGDDHLNRVQAQFTAWRAQRRHAREAFPAELWEAAGQLLANLSVGRVAKALGLSPTVLKQKADPGPSGPAKPEPSLPFVRTRLGEFCPPSGRVDGVWRLVLERPDGAQFKLSLPLAEREMVRALLGEFLKG